MSHLQQVQFLSGSRQPGNLTLLRDFPRLYECGRVILELIPRIFPFNSHLSVLKGGKRRESPLPSVPFYNEMVACQLNCAYYPICGQVKQNRELRDWNISRTGGSRYGASDLAGIVSRDEQRGQHKRQMAGVKTLFCAKLCRGNSGNVETEILHSQIRLWLQNSRKNLTMYHRNR